MHGPGNEPAGGAAGRVGQVRVLDRAAVERLRAAWVEGATRGHRPQVGASADALAAFYAGDRTRILIATVISGVNILNLMWFAAALRTAFRIGKGVPEELSARLDKIEPKGPRGC